MSPTELRAARRADVPGIAALARAALGPSAWTEDQWLDGLLRADAIGHVMVESEQVLGVVFGTAAAEQAELDILAVTEARRRAGHATALLEQFLRAARLRGAREVFLEVRQDNDGARAFYAHHGFVSAGRRRAYYRDGMDAVLLRRALGEVA